MKICVEFSFSFLAKLLRSTFVGPQNHIFRYLSINFPVHLVWTWHATLNIVLKRFIGARCRFWMLVLSPALVCTNKGLSVKVYLVVNILWFAGLDVLGRLCRMHLLFARYSFSKRNLEKYFKCHTNTPQELKSLDIQLRWKTL